MGASPTLRLVLVCSRVKISLEPKSYWAWERISKRCEEEDESDEESEGDEIAQFSDEVLVQRF